MKRQIHVFIVLFFLAVSTERLVRAESLDDSIKYLLDYVANSHGTFIRNGQTHSPQEAANHIKAKYEHFEKEIKTPEDFIRLCASKSLQSGEPYLVRTPDGQEMHLDVWLKNALKEHQAKRHD